MVEPSRSETPSASDEPSVRLSREQLEKIAQNNKHAGLRKLTYGAAIVSGIGAGVIKVWDMFYQNIKGSDIIQTAKNERDAGKQEIFADAKSRAGGSNPMKSDEFGRSMHKVETDFSKNVDEAILKNIGVESRGFMGKVSGTWHRFRALGPYTETKLVFGTIFTTAVALSAFSLLNQRAEVRQNIADLRREIDAQDAQRARA